MLLNCKYKNSNNHVKDRLVALNMAENVDFSLVRNVSEQSETSRGVKYKNVYMLTPDSFKLALMRASEHKTHSVNADNSWITSWSYPKKRIKDNLLFIMRS